MLELDEILLILDKIGREVVVPSTEDFRYEVVSARSSGYHPSIGASGHPISHKDPEISRLQDKLLTMLSVAIEKGKEEEE